VFPGVVEAERRVDYLYQTLERLRALAESAPVGTLSTPPPTLVPFMEVANDAVPRAKAALDDDLNTPVLLSIIADIAKSGNELADLAAKRRKEPPIAKVAPFVASRLAKALVDVTERVGLLQAMPRDYVARTRVQRLALRGIGAETIDAKIVERTQARNNKDFARADALRAELDALGIEIFDSPIGTTWRILP
jgi:cysteinyl-tRNA synthetase